MRMSCKAVLATLFIISLVAVTTLQAQTIYPIDRATILTGSRFDFKVEFPTVVKESTVRVTIDGMDYSSVLGRTATFIEKEEGVEASALLLRDVSLNEPGKYTVVVTDGIHTAEVTWEVYATEAIRKAKNVILFKGWSLC